MENTHKTFLKGGVNVGTLIFLALVVALVMFGSMSFFQGVITGYNITADNVSSTPMYNHSRNLTMRMMGVNELGENNTDTGYIGKLNDNATLTLGEAAAQIASSGFSVIGMGIGLFGSLLGTIKLFFDLAGVLNEVLAMIMDILHLPKFVGTLISGSIVASVFLIILNTILKWNVKDDTR